MGVIMANILDSGCVFFGDFLVKHVSCGYVNFLFFGLVTALILDFLIYGIYPKLKNKYSNIQKEKISKKNQVNDSNNPHDDIFKKRDATKLFYNLLDEFSQKFIHIREAYPTPEEKEKLGANGDIYLIRLQSANDAYIAMKKQFEVVKFFLYKRIPVEEGIIRLWTLLQIYSNDIEFWKSNPGNQALAKKVLNKPADKVMNEVKEITENIKDLLRPNITSIGIRKIENRKESND